MRNSPRITEITHKGRFIGLNMSADFTAEHEWGIADIRKRFSKVGNSEEVFGIEKRRLNEFLPQNWLMLLNEGEYKSYLYFDYLRVYRSESEVEAQKGIYTGAWDDRSFGIGFGKSVKSNCLAMFEAAQRLDLAVWRGGAQFIESPGFNIAIISQIPYLFRKEMEDADKKILELKKAAADLEEKFKLTERLKAKGFKYFALSPNWANKAPTKYRIMYWLNPWEYGRLRQQDLHCGWITVEELEQFLGGDDSVMVNSLRKKRKVAL